MGSLVEVDKLYSVVNNAILRVFGEPFIVQAPAGPVELIGIFEHDYHPEGLVANAQVTSRTKFSDHSYTVQLKSSDYYQHGLRPRLTLTWRTVNFQILEVEGDSFGMKKMAIRNYG